MPSFLVFGDNDLQCIKKQKATLWDLQELVLIGIKSKYDPVKILASLSLVKWNLHQRPSEWQEVTSHLKRIELWVWTWVKLKTICHCLYISVAMSLSCREFASRISGSQKSQISRISASNKSESSFTLFIYHGPFFFKRNNLTREIGFKRIWKILWNVYHISIITFHSYNVSLPLTKIKGDHLGQQVGRLPCTQPT